MVELASGAALVVLIMAVAGIVMMLLECLIGGD